MSERRAFVHEMRNMLGIILGYSTLLLDEIGEGDPKRQDLDEIRKAAQGALALLHSLHPGAPAEELT